MYLYYPIVNRRKLYREGFEAEIYCSLHICSQGDSKLGLAFNSTFTWVAVLFRFVQMLDPAGVI